MDFPDTVDLRYVRDRHGLIWRVVRDGGMAATCSYSGKNWSIGIQALENGHGPLVPVEPDPLTDRSIDATSATIIRGVVDVLDSALLGYRGGLLPEAAHQAIAAEVERLRALGGTDG